jgi:hypothetical protein
MVDDTSAASAGSICPWCSARYTGEPDTCPSCGAALAVDPATDPALPGLTAIDAAAIVRAKTPVARPRNRLLSWISGEYPDDPPSTTETGALAPPPVEVRREMLRLEIEAEMANLQAEAGALLADATAEGRVADAAVTAIAGANVAASADASASPPEVPVPEEAPRADPSNGDGATTPI